MSDSQADMIMSYFKNQLLPPGRRMATQAVPSIDRYQTIEQALGRKAKRTIDRARTAQNYYLSKEVHTPTLEHYEDMDWWERDTSYDFYSYIDGPSK